MSCWHCGSSRWIEMTAFESLILLVFFFAGTVGKPQSLSRPRWEDLVKKSSIIVIATEKEESWIVCKDKMKVAETPLANGNIRLHVPWPKDYVVSRLVRLRIDEILKSRSGIRVSDTITTYLPGLLSLEGSAYFEKGAQYLIFLSPMRAAPTSFAGLTVIPANEILDQGVPVDPSHFYEVVGGANGTLLINEKNLSLLQAAKQAIGRKS